ncbi:uncharacterized protein K444DRAFT_608465 [Hyaloscypha bicolor E]|uniref:Uncharacterized protein n=1 Tax=Hyaloscypha bicolor E TaxID=1095630 RepID=A0A2J6TPA7_9HELO|nr:uncharacterized protein K444DRAFT_608465 [Hyaloscypha bicolor E]PMD64788.1 hypothetical protein K444DRAFT_608465 [Hyaloscypha bicolor E]
MSSYTSETSSTSSLITPNLPQKYVKTSIGGAGNFLPIPSTAPQSQSFSTISSRSSSSTTSMFHAGIGGFGNRHSVEEMAPPQLERATLRSERQSYHVGIGGAGNRRSSRQDGVAKGDGGRSGVDMMTEKVFRYFPW